MSVFRLNSGFYVAHRAMFFDGLAAHVKTAGRYTCRCTVEKNCQVLGKTNIL